MNVVPAAERLVQLHINIFSQCWQTCCQGYLQWHRKLTRGCFVIEAKISGQADVGGFTWNIALANMQ